VTSQTRRAQTAGFLHHGQSRRRAAAVNMPASQTCRPGLTAASTGTPSTAEEPRPNHKINKPVYTDTLTSSRLVPISNRFLEHVTAYLETERPADAGTEQLFVVLKRPRRGQPLTAAGLDEVLEGARDRAGLAHATCHELRHTCLTRLREAGMALEAVQAQAGHASIESTRIYLHLADDWLASQYRKAAEAIDAQVFAAHPISGSIR
jgi:integrase